MGLLYCGRKETETERERSDKMADPRNVEYEEEETPIDEQLISAIKYNSVGTFNAVLERFDSPEAAVEYLNTHALAYKYQDRDVKKEAGNVAAHVAASLGQGKIPLTSIFRYQILYSTTGRKIQFINLKFPI